METDPDVRDAPESNWSFIIQTFKELIPLFSDPDPGLPTGDLVITEIMPNPDQVGESSGEYIEIFNHTGGPINMVNWIIVDDGDNQATFSGTIEPGDLFVIGVSADLNGGEPGGVPDAVWTDSVGDLTVTNSNDVISILDANGDLVTSIGYGYGATINPGVSIEIAVANQHPNGQTFYTQEGLNHYLESQTAFGDDLGSPGTRGDSQFPLPECPVTISIVGDDFELGFPAARAVTYVLWDSPDLDDWNEVLGEDPVIGNGIHADFTFPRPDDDRHFYQLIHDYAAPE